MSSDEELQDFLEHVGVKGMKWGRRKNRGGPQHSRKQKLAIVGASAASFLVVGNIATLRTMNAKVGFIAGTAAAVTGAKVASNMIDKHGSTPMSELKTRRG